MKEVIKKSTFLVAVIAVLLVGAAITGCFGHDVNDTNDTQNYEDPDIAATENHEDPDIAATEDHESPVISATEDQENTVVTATENTDDDSDETVIVTGELAIIDDELTADGIERESEESVGTVYSDDGKYKIEGYGIDYSVVVSGENPVKEIRIVEISSGKTVWNTVGLYLLYEQPNFCWSPDSRYVSVMYAARIWVDAMIVDTKDMSEYSLPGLFELSHLFPEFSPRSERADPYIIPEYWLNDHTIIVAFSWVPASGLSPEKDRLEGKYQYDANTQELTVISIDS